MNRNPPGRATRGILSHFTGTNKAGSPPRERGDRAAAGSPTSPPPPGPWRGQRGPPCPPGKGQGDTGTDPVPRGQTQSPGASPTPGTETAGGRFAPPHPYPHPRPRRGGCAAPSAASPHSPCAGAGRGEEGAGGPAQSPGGVRWV